jgi:choline dehydrogenase-like flavoprotein
MFGAAPMTASPYLPPFIPPYADGFGCRVVLLHPESRGYVDLASSDPRAPVRIVQNFLASERDSSTLRAGLRLARDVGRQSPLQRKRPACDVLHRRVELSRLRAMVGSPVRVCAAAEERAYDAGRNCMLLRLRRIQ